MYAGSAVVAGSLVTVGAHLLCAVFNGASSALYVDNSAVNVLAATSPGAAAMNPLIVGSSSAIAATSSFAEDVVYQGSDTLAQRQQTFAYLASRYGQSWA